MIDAFGMSDVGCIRELNEDCFCVQGFEEIESEKKEIKANESAENDKVSANCTENIENVENVENDTDSDTGAEDKKCIKDSEASDGTEVDEAKTSGSNKTQKGFCILADGMGGHNAGEVASQNAVKFIAEELNKMMENNDTEIPGGLIKAVSYANEKVYTMAALNPIHSGMGTTVVAAYIDGDTAYVANVGDSRAYAVREDEIFQITTDHSVVAELVRCGSITPEEARRHPQKNIITRAVGTDTSVRTDVFEYDYAPGDILLLCSDGLSTMLEDMEILEIVRNGSTSEEIVTSLIDAAKEYGGLDNITVICVRFLD